MNGSAELFPEFECQSVATEGGHIFARVGGAGPALLLLHGYPQSHAAWHRVAPALARHFTVVAADLTGYGHSSIPPTDMDHRPYSKRSMAARLAHTMSALGHERFGIMGHDRGARVAYRMALDLPDRVERVVLIDILSTLDHWESAASTQPRLSTHWPLLAQPAPIPESLIGRDPIGWLEGRLQRGTAAKSLAVFDRAALEEYRTAIRDPDRVHAMCEDHRAGAQCDLEDDREDRDAGHRIGCPGMIVVGSVGALAAAADAVAPWRPWFTTLISAKVEAGHYMPEENADGLVAATLPFLLGEIP
jgi:haloacetate dehalogenase